MHPHHSVLAVFAAVFLTGCVPTEADLARQKIATSTECLTGACRFDNAPLELQPETVRISGRSYDFNRLSKPLQFTDGDGRKWLAPQSTLTDGASIPPVFVPIIGLPREPEFANAAALHDAYCGIGNETGPVYHAKTWQEVHRLLYDALVAGGTEPTKAKIMFAAVWLGGPRWYPQGGSDSRLMAVSPMAKQAALRRVMRFIKAEKPDMERLIARLTVEERVMLASVREGQEVRPDPVVEPPPTDPVDPPLPIVQPVVATP